MKPNMKILVVAPMQREYDNFTAALNHFSSLGNEYTVINAGVGKVATAAGVARALTAMESDPSKGQYDLVVLVGYAAGSRAFKQGQLVIPNKTCYHDTVAPKGFIPEFDTIYELAGKDDVLVLTGDVFVDTAIANDLEVRFGTKIIYEMEAAAACQVCVPYGIPVMVLKYISDVPQDDHNVESFEEFVNSHTDFTAFVDYLEKM